MRCDFYDGGVKAVTLPAVPFDAYVCVSVWVRVCISVGVAVGLSGKGTEGAGSEMLGDDVIS